MNPSLSVELIQDDFVLDVLKQTVDTMDTIETLHLRGNGSRFLNSKVMKKSGDGYEGIELKVVTATNISKPSAWSEKIMRLRKQSRNVCDEPHHM